MNYFIKQLCVCIIWILIMTKCDCISHQKHLEQEIIKCINKGKLMGTESNGFYLKPEINGKLGHGTSGLLWRCKLLFLFKLFHYFIEVKINFRYA